MSIFYNTNVKQQYFLFFFVPCHVHIRDKSCFFDKYETITHKRKEIEKHLLVSFQVSSGRLHLFPVCIYDDSFKQISPTILLLSVSSDKHRRGGKRTSQQFALDFQCWDDERWSTGGYEEMSFCCLINF